MPSEAFLFVVFVVVGPSDLGLCLTGARHYSRVGGKPKQARLPLLPTSDLCRTVVTPFRFPARHRLY